VTCHQAILFGRWKSGFTSSCYRYVRREWLAAENEIQQIMSSLVDRCQRSLSLSSVEIKYYHRTFINSCLTFFYSYIFQVIVHIHYIKDGSQYQSKFSIIPLFEFHLIHKVFLVPFSSWQTYESVLHYLNFIAFISFHNFILNILHYVLSPIRIAFQRRLTHIFAISCDPISCLVVTFSFKSRFNLLLFIYCVV